MKYLDLDTVSGIVLKVKTSNSLGPFPDIVIRAFGGGTDCRIVLTKADAEQLVIALIYATGREAVAGLPEELDLPPTVIKPSRVRARTVTVLGEAASRRLRRQEEKLSKQPLLDEEVERAKHKRRRAALEGFDRPATVMETGAELRAKTRRKRSRRLSLDDQNLGGND